MGETLSLFRSSFNKSLGIESRLAGRAGVRSARGRPGHLSAGRRRGPASGRCRDLHHEPATKATLKGTVLPPLNNTPKLSLAPNLKPRLCPHDRPQWLLPAIRAWTRGHTHDRPHHPDLPDLSRAPTPARFLMRHRRTVKLLLGSGDHQIMCDATMPASAIRPTDGRDRGAWWPRSNGIRENFAHGSVSS